MKATAATQRSLDRIADSMAKAEDRGWSSDYYLLHYRLKALLPRIKGPRVLELGCAEGGMTRELVKHFPAIVAVDGSPALIEKAEREIKTPNLTLACSLLEEFEPEGKFDSIVMACILEHVEHVVPVLKRTKQWLMPEGA